VPIANPLIQGRPGGSATAAPPPTGSPSDSTESAAPASAAAGGFSSTLSGIGLSDPYNTPLGVATLVLAALGVVFLLHVAGFRFILDAGVRSR
jgi:hypothetical protein